MSGFDDDFLSGPVPAPAPAPSAKGAASPSPPAVADDFDGFGVTVDSAQPEAGLVSPEAAYAARAAYRASKAKIADFLRAHSHLLADGFGVLAPDEEANADAGQADAAGARRVRAALARVTPKHWAVGLGVLALAAGLTFGVRWWMQRPPASPVVATAKAEAPVASAASIAAVAPTPVVTAPVPPKPAAPVVAATVPAAAPIAPQPPPPAVAGPTVAPPPVTKVARAPVIHTTPHAEKRDDAWANDQAARLDAFFKKKH